MRTASTRLAAALLALALAGPAAAQGKGARDESDGDKVVGLWGVAYFGQHSFDFGAPALGNPVDVHVIGVRHWLTGPSTGALKGIGLDLGVGFGWNDQKVKVPVPGGTLTTEASGFGFGLHGGLPLALARTRHATFLVIPEIDLVRASGSNDAPGPTSTDWGGWAFDLGARAGFELHFGFWDVPQLSVQGTVGAAFRYASATSTIGGVDTTVSGWRFGTERPADFIVGNVAAIYYF